MFTISKFTLLIKTALQSILRWGGFLGFVPPVSSQITHFIRKQQWCCMTKSGRDSVSQHVGHQGTLLNTILQQEFSLPILENEVWETEGKVKGFAEFTRRRFTAIGYPHRMPYLRVWSKNSVYSSCRFLDSSWHLANIAQGTVKPSENLYLR